MNPMGESASLRSRRSLAQLSIVKMKSAKGGMEQPIKVGGETGSTHDSLSHDMIFIILPSVNLKSPR